VWQKAHAFVIAIRRVTRPFRKTEFAGIATQLVKAAESISATIVEGCGASSQREFARFLDMSIKSSSECEYWLQLSLDEGALVLRAWRYLTTEVVDIRRMLCGLRRKVLIAAAQEDARKKRINRKRTTDNAQRGSRKPDAVARKRKRGRPKPPSPPPQQSDES
jgi:four helix bundle protein